jgi:hypothetical protein
MMLHFILILSLFVCGAFAHPSAACAGDAYDFAGVVWIALIGVFKCQLLACIMSILFHGRQNCEYSMRPDSYNFEERIWYHGSAERCAKLEISNIRKKMWENLIRELEKIKLIPVGKLMEMFTRMHITDIFMIISSGTKLSLKSCEDSTIDMLLKTKTKYLSGLQLFRNLPAALILQMLAPMQIAGIYAVIFGDGKEAD